MFLIFPHYRWPQGSFIILIMRLLIARLVRRNTHLQIERNQLLHKLEIDMLKLPLTVLLLCLARVCHADIKVNIWHWTHVILSQHNSPLQIVSSTCQVTINGDVANWIRCPDLARWLTLSFIQNFIWAWTLIFSLSIKNCKLEFWSCVDHII